MSLGAMRIPLHGSTDVENLDRMYRQRGSKLFLKRRILILEEDKYKK